MFGDAINRLLSLRNSVRRRITIVIDSVLLAVAAWLAISLVRGRLVSPGTDDAMAITTVVIITVVALILTKSYRAIIRHLDVQTIARILFSLVVASLAWIAIAVYSGYATPNQLTLLLAQCIFSLLLLIGYRLAIFQIIGTRSKGETKADNVAVFGLGEGSRQFAASLSRSKAYKPVFFFSDDASLDGGLVDGLRVYSHDHLDWALGRFSPKFFVFPDAERRSGKHAALVENLLGRGIGIRLFDSVDHSLGRKPTMELARPLEIEDLLGRKANPVALDLLERAVAGNRILVTGAAGSIGRAIAMRINSLGPDSLGLLDMDESGLVALMDEIGGTQNKPLIHLGSIADRAFVEDSVASGGYDTIIHAAAYKHVTMGEICPAAMIENNITGTRNLVEVAIANGVKHFVQVSTDKSVEPASVMGATKFFCERLVGAHAAPAEGRHYASVRFGNVIESRGSVIPIFKKQIAKGGPVTITDAQMQRYFMSIEEAVDLVIQAMAMAEGGETFILEMGEPHSILDIAKSVIRLAGKSWYLEGSEKAGDIEIVFTGKHKGEKLQEKLFADFEEPVPSPHPAIQVSTAAQGELNRLLEFHDALKTAAGRAPSDVVRKMLFDEIDTLSRH